VDFQARVQPELLVPQEEDRNPFLSGLQDVIVDPIANEAPVLRLETGENEDVSVEPDHRMAERRAFRRISYPEIDYNPNLTLLRIPAVQRIPEAS